MATINGLIGSGTNKDLTFTTLYHSGKDGSGTETYTITANYDYIIISAHDTTNNTNASNPSCNQGVLIGTYYNNSSGGSGTQVRTTIKIWQDVGNGAVCSFTTGSRHGWCITGVNWNGNI